MRTLVTHLGLIAGLAGLIVLCIAYPFLAGEFDLLAVPLSTMAQVFGVVGLPLVPVGLLWLWMPRHGFVFAILSLAAGTFAALVLALFATLGVGKAFGVLMLAVWVLALVRLVPRVTRARHAAAVSFNPAPLYLVILPAVAFLAQLALAAPATTASRARAIANARAFIDGIEAFHATHGRYPVTLQAQHKDYNPDVIGVALYVYAPNGDGYDLAFEQPRFLLDRFGTREWVVYNPRGRHRMYSHTAWRLNPAGEAGSGQGWYASGETGYRGWRYFWFD
jgi:hypothetical protein